MGSRCVDEAGRDALLIENHASPYDMEEITSDSTKRWPPTYQAVRTDRYLYVEYETGERELYDYQVDPFELDNLHRGLGRPCAFGRRGGGRGSAPSAAQRTQRLFPRKRAAR